MNNITLQQQALLELIKIGIGTSDGSFDFSQLVADDWKAIYDESRNQSIGLLCFDATKGISDFIPQSIYNEWLTGSAKTLAANMKVQSVQRWLCRLLDENGIPYVILKGMGSASFYPNPDMRPLGDVDFITSADRFADTERLLIENGCKKDVNGGIIHYSYFKDGIELEHHFDISGIPEGRSGEIVRNYLQNIIKDYKTERDFDIFRCPDDKLHGMVILLHVLHHILSVGIGLRQICDWACFVNKTITSSFWTDSFIPVLKDAGLFKFASILTAVTVRFLGVQSPEWLPEIGESLSAQFIEEIFRAGNFGTKVKQVAGTLMMLTKDSQKQTLPRKVKAMLNALNSTNHRVYPILNKAPWLYPFIMVWRVLRYLCLSLVGKRQSLGKVSKFADERSVLLSKFDLYKTDKE